MTHEISLLSRSLSPFQLRDDEFKIYYKIVTRKKQIKANQEKRSFIASDWFILLWFKAILFHCV
jgi:hypothetical protein